FKTASTVIAERLLDLLSVVVMLALALAGGPIPDGVRAFALVAAPLAFVGFVALVVLARRRTFTEKLATRILTSIPKFGKDSALTQRLLRWLDHFLDGLQPLANNRTLFQAFAWSAISWGFSAVAGYILMLTFYEQASWPATLL